jgi:iron complex outermembrane receptor protein
MNGFVNVAPAQVADVDGSNPRLVTFDPEQANQYEFGVKANLLKDKIAATVSYYDITVKNRVMGDPENVNSSIQGGEVNSKGYEFSLVASPVSGLNLVAGYSHNDSEVTKDNPGDGYLGLRPEEAGPSDLVNFWASYTVQAGKLAGLGLGFGGNYASEYMTLNRATTGTFTLPSYTVLNAALSYTKSRYSLILKVDNLTDERYWTGWSTVTPQRLRSVSLSLSYKF